MGCVCGSEEAPINPNEVDLSHFEMHKCVGRGGFGRVHAAVKKSDGKMYAIKTMDKQFLLAKEGNLATIWAERNVMAKFNSNFLVRLHHAFQDNNMLYLVMDFMKGGDLRYYLDKRGAMNEQMARFFAAEILLALEEMHSLHIVYTDLKPENVLLDEDGHICISDFGLCVQLKASHHYLTSGERGTDGYLAPEILNKEKYGVSPDVWTFGVMLYELLHNHLPFRAAKDSYKEPLMIKETYSDEVGDLLAGLLKIDPRRRLGCGTDGWAAVKRHTWFRSIDWERARNKQLVPPFKPDPNVANCSPIFDLEDQLLYEKKVYKFSDEQQAKFRGFNFNVALGTSKQPLQHAAPPRALDSGRGDKPLQPIVTTSAASVSDGPAAGAGSGSPVVVDGKSDGFDPVFPEGRMKGMTIMEQKNTRVNPAPKRAGNTQSTPGTSAAALAAASAASAPLSAHGTAAAAGAAAGSESGAPSAAAVAGGAGGEATDPLSSGDAKAKLVERGSLRMKSGQEFEAAAAVNRAASLQATLSLHQREDGASATAAAAEPIPEHAKAGASSAAPAAADATAQPAAANPLADAMAQAVATHTAPVAGAAAAPAAAHDAQPAAATQPQPSITADALLASLAAPAVSASAPDHAHAHAHATDASAAHAPVDIATVTVDVSAPASASASASATPVAVAPAPAVAVVPSTDAAPDLMASAVVVDAHALSPALSPVHQHQHQQQPTAHADPSASPALSAALSPVSPGSRAVSADTHLLPSEQRSDAPPS